MIRDMRRAAWLLTGLIATSGGAGAVERLTVDRLEALALRSPNVFDVFFRTLHAAESRTPAFYFDGGAVVGPTYLISVDGVDREAHVAGGGVSLGSVFWRWKERAGTRAGMDFFSTNLTTKGSANEDGWGYRTFLLHGGAFNKDAGWSATAGLFVRIRPVTAIVNGERVFSFSEPVEETTTGDFSYTPDSGGKTTETETARGFVAGTIPGIGLTGGLTFGRGRIEQAKGKIDLTWRNWWESLGPVFGTIPAFNNYQAGIQAKRFRPWTAPITVSAEATGRKERGLGTGFDHALASADIVLFENEQAGDARTSDFKIRLEAGGSYLRRPEVKDKAGWGFLVDGIFETAGGAVVHLALGGGHSYYDHIVMLPVADITIFRFQVGVEL